jgi:uncharacterized protein (TIGR02444 family)
MLRSANMAMSPSPPLSAAGEFWQFSLAFYARPGVEAACLALQDQHGRDVNIMLYLCWLGLTARGRIDRDGLARAEEAMAPWRRAAIEPLRKARRDLDPAERDGVAALYEAAKAIELAAERMGQQRLAALAPPPVAGLADKAAAAADAAANLTLYLSDAAERDAAAPLFAALAAHTVG